MSRCMDPKLNVNIMNTCVCVCVCRGIYETPNARWPFVHNKTHRCMNRAHSSYSMYVMCSPSVRVLWTIACNSAWSQAAEEVQDWMADSEKPRLLKREKRRSGKKPRGGEHSAGRVYVLARARSYIHGSPTHWLKPAALELGSINELTPSLLTAAAKSWNLDCINSHGPQT